MTARNGSGRPGQMIVANHPSLIDVVFLIGAISRDTNCIVKAGLWAQTVHRGPVRCGAVHQQRRQADMLEQAADVLRDGQTLVDVSRGHAHDAGPAPPVFHRGAAAIALRGARVITPVFITRSPTTLTKAEPWYRIPPPPRAGAPARG